MGGGGGGGVCVGGGVFVFSFAFKVCVKSRTGSYVKGRWGLLCLSVTTTWCHRMLEYCPSVN